jgi:hypothetical protein
MKGVAGGVSVDVDEKGLPEGLCQLRREDATLIVPLVTREADFLWQPDFHVGHNRLFARRPLQTADMPSLD